jgi:hypothetical protein
MYREEIGWEALEWIYLAHDTDNKQAVVNTVIKLGLPKTRGISWLS